jgi:hypothetical protein
VCPGSRMQTSVPLVTTFVLVMCLFAAAGSFVPEVQDRLLEAGAASSAATVDGRSPLLSCTLLHARAAAACNEAKTRNWKIYDACDNVP